MFSKNIIMTNPNNPIIVWKCNIFLKKITLLSSSSEYIEFPLNVLGHDNYFRNESEEDISSSDDEMYSTLRYKLSKRQNSNHLKIYYRTDESDLSSKLSSNVVNVDSINTSKTDSCNKSFDNNLLSDQTLKKYNKRNEEFKKPTFFQLPNKIID